MALPVSNGTTLQESIRDSQINEPLLNWHSIDGEIAFVAVRESEGWAGDVSDKTMTSLSSFIKHQDGLSVLPDSTAGLSALVEMNQQNLLPGDCYVAVITGKKSCPKATPLFIVRILSVQPMEKPPMGWCGSQSATG